MKRRLIGQCIKFMHHMRYDRRCWYMNNEYHRDDGPAVENTNTNSCWWYKCGVCVRSVIGGVPIDWRLY